MLASLSFVRVCLEQLVHLLADIADIVWKVTICGPLHTHRANRRVPPRVNDWCLGWSSWSVMIKWSQTKCQLISLEPLSQAAFQCWPELWQAQNPSHVVFGVFILSYSTIHLLQNTFYSSNPKIFFSNWGYARFIRTIMTSEKIK